MPIKKTLVLPTERDERWALARQIGVTSATSRLPGQSFSPSSQVDANRTATPSFEALSSLQQRFKEAGFVLNVLEDVYPPLEDVRLGRDREGGVEKMCDLVRIMGAVGIPVLSYSWMAGQNWTRTSTSVRSRGDSLVSGYDHEQMRDEPPIDIAPVEESTLWENLEYFLERVVPVAEDAGVKLALHPDDPPLSPIRGVGRIITSPDAMERAIDLVPSPNNGVAFCQGTFSAMGADIPTAITRFADRINYVHFRDVRGTAEDFVETWHDDGQTEMLEAMRTYEKIGFAGPMRPDHVPTMAGEDNTNPGYEMQGRLFAIGYMTGLLEQVSQTE